MNTRWLVALIMLCSAVQADTPATKFGCNSAADHDDAILQTLCRFPAFRHHMLAARAEGEFFSRTVQNQGHPLA